MLGWAKCWALDLQEADRGRRAWAPESHRPHTDQGSNSNLATRQLWVLGEALHPPPHMFLIKELSGRAVARMKGDAQERPGCEAKPSLGPGCSTPVQYLACSPASPLPYPLIGNLNSTPGVGSQSL